MSYIAKPKSELLEHLDAIQSDLFPSPLPRKIKAFLADTADENGLQDECLDAVEGLIVRISRCEDCGEMARLVERADLKVQACLWERFLFLQQLTRQLPDDPHIVPATIGRYLRESLSALWHNHQSRK